MAGGPPGPEHRGRLGRAVHPAPDGQARVPHIEGREPVGLPADHRHAQGFEVFEGAGQVAEGLDPRRDHHHRMAGQGGEVLAHVPGDGRALMHAADPAGGHDLYADRRGQRHRGRDGGDPHLQPPGRRRTEVAGGDLDGAGGQPVGLGPLRAYHRLTVEDPGQRRHGPGGSHRGHGPVQAPAVGRGGQAQFGEHGRLQRHHRSAGGQPGPHLVAHPDDGGTRARLGGRRVGHGVDGRASAGCRPLPSGAAS